jgi:DNA-binding CsgD family transcriptional regulator
MRSVHLLLVTAPIEKSRARELLAEFRKRAPEFPVRLVGPLPGGDAEVLTPRQREILREIAMGASVKEIAIRLGISPKTVETHRSKLMELLGIHRVPGLVRYALQTGDVPADWLLGKG